MEIMFSVGAISIPKYKEYAKYELPFSELVGKTVIGIENEDNEVLRFFISPTEVYELFHRPDWCEEVIIEDICGDLNDLVDTPIIEAEEVSNNDELEGVEIKYKKDHESHTWTFYKLRTIKGSVTIRWLGTSNGYYSEKVSFRRIVKK